jgi:2-oxoisovalerate dehydrogenase E1 component alpha subunit
LVRERLWSDAQESAARDASTARVEQAVADFLAIPPREPASMFEHLFAELPAALHEQRDSLLRSKNHE